MQIDPRRLTVLLAVQRAGSVTKAAELLHLSPSAVSQQIARLEREIGATALVRQSTGVALTDVGRLLVETGERIEAELLDTQRSLAELAGHISGTVTVAAFRTIARALFVPLLERLAERFPGVDLAVIETIGDRGAEGMRTGLFDLLVVEADTVEGRSTPRGNHDIPLLDEPWLLLTSTSVPVPRTLDDLTGSTWLGTEPDSASRLATERVLRRIGTVPISPHAFYDYDVAVAMVASGLGLALVPSLALPPTPPATVRVSALPGLGTRTILLRHRASRTEPRREVRAVIGEAIAAASELHLTAESPPGRGGRAN